jgi:hypothetical protein
MKLTDETYLQVFERVGKNDMQNVFTPPRLIRRMLSRVNFMSNDKVLVWYNVEFVIFLVREVGLRPENIYIYTNTQDKLILRNNGYNVIYQEDIDFDKMSKLINVKFDVVIGNPPYQKQVGPKKTEAIWPKFVDKSFEICKEDGYVSLIHPIGWRDVDGKYKNTQKLLLSKNVVYLAMNDIKDGVKTFGVKTPYDWYVVKNIENNNNYYTEILDHKGIINKICLFGLEYIPNCNFDFVINLIANNGEETVDVLYDCSYHHQYDNTSKEMVNGFIYPCVYSIKKDNIPTFYYSNTNGKGHFNIPKVIFGNGANPTYMVDYNGEFGMCEFTYGVINYDLNIIEQSLKSKKISLITEAFKYNNTQGQPIFNRRILSTFKKDFWRYFLDENNNVIDPNFENVERI